MKECFRWISQTVLITSAKLCRGAHEGIRPEFLRQSLVILRDKSRYRIPIELVVGCLQQYERESMDHLSYNPDIALEIPIFLDSLRSLADKLFVTEANVKQAVSSRILKIYTDFFYHRTKALVTRWGKCSEVNCNYVGD